MTLNFQESIPGFEKNSNYYETCFLLVCGKKWDSAKKKLHRQNQCWTEGRSSTAVAEGLGPTATATYLVGMIAG